MSTALLKVIINFRNETAIFLAAHTYLLASQLATLEHPESKQAAAAKELESLVNKDYKSPTEYLLARLFVSYISAFEIFLQELTAAVATEYPKKLGQSTFTLEEIIDSADKSVLVDRAIDFWLNKTMYKKPKEYIADLESLLSIDTSARKADWLTYIEAKARRDLGVHSSWRCNPTYRRKVTEAGMTTTAKDGEMLLPVDDAYLENVSAALDRLSAECGRKVAEKYWPHLLEALTDEH